MTQPDPTAPDHRFSRRGVMGGAALGAGLAVAGGLEEPASARRRGLPRRVDVVVVGGGISGLVAARHLVAAGRRVLVVEARDRVGGRVLNHQLGSGDTIESGGAFIGPTQNHIRALADQLGVSTFKEYVAGKSVYNSHGPLGRQEYDGTVPPDPTILADAAVLQTQLDSWAAEIDVAAPWAHPRAKEWDSQTLGDYIRRSTVNSSGTGNLVKCWAEPAFGADPDELSLLFTLWYIACSGDEQNKGTFERNSNTADGAQDSRFVGGSQLVPLRLAAQLGRRRIALRAPVRRIVQRRHHAVVHTARGAVRCQQVVVAVPPPMALQIAWRPALPAQRRALLQGMPMGHLMKCDAVYATPFWRAKGLSGFGISDSGAVRAAFDNCPADGSPGVLLAFVGGDTWRQYGLQSLEARKAAVLTGFAEMFGPEARSPIDYVEHDWDFERWTGGGPVAVMGPGTLSTYGPTIRVPFRHVHWAGTETSTYWTGYMDGAVRAGERAAAEVLAVRRRRRHR